jgi:hypothetical protein
MLDYTKMSLEALQERFNFLDDDSQMSDAHNVWDHNRREMMKIKHEVESRYAKV